LPRKTVGRSHGTRYEGRQGADAKSAVGRPPLISPRPVSRFVGHRCTAPKKKTKNRCTRYAGRSGFQFLISAELLIHLVEEPVDLDLVDGFDHEIGEDGEDENAAEEQNVILEYADQDGRQEDDGHVEDQHDEPVAVDGTLGVPQRVTVLLVDGFHVDLGAVFIDFCNGGFCIILVICVPDVHLPVVPEEILVKRQMNHIPFFNIPISMISLYNESIFYSKGEYQMADKDQKEKKFSRRDFLKTTGAATGGIIGGSLLGGSIGMNFGSDTSTGEEEAQQTEESGGQESGGTENPGRMFFHNDADFETISQAMERIFPEDDLGPGAIKLGVPYFLDMQLDGAYGNNSKEYMQGPFHEGET